MIVALAIPTLQTRRALRAQIAALSSFDLVWPVAGRETTPPARSGSPPTGFRVPPHVQPPRWTWRTQQLIALLTSSAPLLRSLECCYPLYGLNGCEPTFLEDIGQLSRLTSLALDFAEDVVSTAEVGAMLRTLPALQRLVLAAWEGEQHLVMDKGFPAVACISCPRLQHLEVRCGNLGDLSPELGDLTALTHLSLVGGGNSYLYQGH